MNVMFISGLERMWTAVRPVPISASNSPQRRKPSATPALVWTAASSQIPPATSPAQDSVGRRWREERQGNTRDQQHFRELISIIKNLVECVDCSEWPSPGRSVPSTTISTTATFLLPAARSVWQRLAMDNVLRLVNSTGKSTLPSLSLNLIWPHSNRKM